MPNNKNTKREPDFPKGVGQPAARALALIGVTRLEQLVNHREADLLKLHGMGAKSLHILKAALYEKGLAFAKIEKK